MRGYLLLLCGILFLLPNSFTYHNLCNQERINGDDALFCNGDMSVIYPDIGNVACMYIPNCFNYSQSISDVWDSPQIQYTMAHMGQIYTLVMVDPDVPSRSEPKFRFWRHWLVTDIMGRDLLDGNSLLGNVVSPYMRPNPTQWAGYHRYQFLLFVQPPGTPPTLSPNEEETLGSWDLNGFVVRSGLGLPVATTQFMLENIHQ